MRNVARAMLASFGQGLLALLPLIVSGYLLFVLLQFVRRMIDDAVLLLPPAARTDAVLVILVQVGAVILVFFAIAGLGALVRTVAGRALVRGMDRLFIGVPVLSPIYRATRQVVDVLSERPHKFFTRPVLVEYPSTGVWAVAFHTGSAPPTLSPDASEQYVTLFIPTTPNPTSGWLAMVPESRIRPLPLSVEDAMKLVLTGGVVKG